MAEIKLKPCPFCQGEVIHIFTNHKSLKCRVFTYMCKKCEAFIYLTIKSKYVSKENTKKEAEEVWNRRADNVGYL